MLTLTSLPLAAVLTASGSGGGASVAPAGAATPAVTALTLQSGPVVATTPSSFWSVVAQTNDPRGVVTSPAVQGFLNSTPFRWVRYDSGTDQCNWATNTMYSDSGAVTGACPLNISALKVWCATVIPRCHAILTLPGENNDSMLDAAVAKYIVQTVGFQPDYWAIGNEPTGWTHYGIPWARWSVADHTTPTALAYAFDVKAAIRAVSVVDPGAKFIGIEAACQCNANWFQAVARVDGALISAVALHTYPSVGLTAVTVPQFLAPLAGPNNLSSAFADVRSALLGQCAACSTLPILVNEFNAGPGWSPSNLAGSYPNAVFLAASVVQALRVNVTQLTFFNLQTWSTGVFGYSMMDNANTIGPTGLLFSQMLNHLTMGRVRAVGLPATVGNLWAVESESPSHRSLLVVNANLTQTVQLAVGDAFPTGGVGQEYRWTPSTARPQSSARTLASTYALSPETILLLNSPSPTSVPGGPSVEIIGNRTQGAAPLSVAFSSLVQGGAPPYRYSWSFGDGATSSLAGSDHTFTGRGIFPVRLNVTDSAGRLGLASSAVTVGTYPLALSVSASVTTGPVPLCAALGATATGGLWPYSTAWSFGDGTPDAGGSSVTHCFNATGNFSGRATTTDAAGSSVVATVNFTVVGSIQLSLRASENPARLGDSVLLTAVVTGGQGPTTIIWTVNGTPVPDNNSTLARVMTSVGPYLVSAKVRDSAGGSAQANVSVSVLPAATGNASSGATQLSKSKPSDQTVWATGLALVTVGVAVLAAVGHRSTAPTPDRSRRR